MRILLVPIAAVAILSGCSFDVAPELYVSDLKDVADGTEPALLTPTTLTMTIPSCDRYDEFAARLVDIAIGMLPEFRPKGCDGQGFGDLLRAEAQIPIVAVPKVWQETGSMFGFLAEPHGGNVIVTMLVDQNKQRVLSDRLDDELHQSLELSKSRIKVVLNNDLRAVHTYVVKGVFVDGLPIAEPERFQLKRRRTAEITLSNVAASRLARHGAVHALILEPTVEPSVEPGPETVPQPAEHLPPAAVVASALPTVKEPPAPHSHREEIAAQAPEEAAVPEAYYVQVRNQVNTIAARSYPRRSLDLGEEGTVTMLIRVREDGSLIDVRIQEERTDAPVRLQRAAQRAVLRAAPFAPLPSGAGVKTILLPIEYNITRH
ncbi:MAG: TonB family protein [Rhodospirillales bacterium]|nr:TonB family protein [Rhodospirillales bacterium]